MSSPTSSPPAAGLRAGVLGARGIGAVHARELAAAGARSLVVAGATPPSAVATAGRLTASLGRAVGAAADLHDLRAQAPDFISICTPVEMHAAHVEALQGAGTFLFVEKPFIWGGARRADDLIDQCRRLFEKSHGKLAVNHPTGVLGAAWLAAVDGGKPVRTLDVRYQTRGRFGADMIAVDLLPHALSLLLVLAARTGACVEAPRSVNVERGVDTWSTSARFGEVACRFEFIQESSAATSELAFVVDGVAVRRTQVAAGDGMRVGLAFDGREVAVENPMRTTIWAAVAHTTAGTVPAAEHAFNEQILRFMAGLLLG